MNTLRSYSQNDANKTNEEPLTDLLHFFQTALETIPTFRPKIDSDNINNIIPIGQELFETSDKTIAGIDDNFLDLSSFVKTTI